MRSALRLFMLPVGICLCLGIGVVLVGLLVLQYVPGLGKVLDQAHSDLQGAIDVLSKFWDKL